MLKEYPKLVKTAIFFVAIIPQLGFLLMYIYLFLKRSDLIDCIKQDLSNKFNTFVLAVLAIMAIISTMLTIAPLQVSILYLVYIIGIILGFYAIRISSVAKEEFLKMYLYSVSIFTVFGIFQWVFHIEVVKQVGPLLINIFFLNGNRISSLAGHPMVLAGLATFAFLVGIILTIYYKSNIRYLYLFLSFIALLNIVFTGSRAAFLAAILGLFLILFFMYPKKVFINLLIIVSFLLFLFGLTKIETYLVLGNKGVTNQSTIERFKTDNTGSGRVGLWKDSISLIQNKPFFGYGPDSWNIAMHNFVKDKYHNEEGDITDSHNTFLSLSIHFGVIFATIFMLFITYKIIKQSIALFSSFKIGTPMSAGLVSMVCVIMFLGIVDNPLSSITMTVVFMLFAGLLFSFNKHPSEEGQP